MVDDGDDINPLQAYNEDNDEDYGDAEAPDFPLDDDNDDSSDNPFFDGDGTFNVSVDEFHKSKYEDTSDYFDSSKYEDFGADDRARRAVKIPDKESIPNKGIYDNLIKEAENKKYGGEKPANSHADDEFAELYDLAARKKPVYEPRQKSEVKTFSVEFEDDSAPKTNRTAPIKNFYGTKPEIDKKDYRLPPQQNSVRETVTFNTGGDSANASPQSRESLFAQTTVASDRHTAPNFQKAENPPRRNLRDNPFFKAGQKTDGFAPEKLESAQTQGGFHPPELREAAPQDYTYQLDGGFLSSCKIESWTKSYSLFADFMRDARKYYKKTCLMAHYIYYFSYRPMYKELNHEQLCWYLMWRSKVRGGDYAKTGLSYIFLYIYEQINLVDLIEPDKVYRNIINIWKNYRGEFPRIDKYIAEWLIDFSLIHRIDIDMGEIEAFLPDILGIITLPEMFLPKDFYKKPEFLPLIITMSAYDYKKSKFCNEKNAGVFDTHVKGILSAVLNCGKFESLIVKEISECAKVKTVRESFSGAVCSYENKKKISLEYLNIYKNFFLRQLVTDVIRQAENMIREFLGVKARLALTTQLQFDSIFEEYTNANLITDKQREQAAKNAAREAARAAAKAAKSGDIYDEQEAPKEFNPDLFAAAEIEKQSWDTTHTLVQLQERDANAPPKTASAEKPEAESKPAPVVPAKNRMVSRYIETADFLDKNSLESITEQSEPQEKSGAEPEASKKPEALLSGTTPEEKQKQELVPKPSEEARKPVNVSSEFGLFVESLSETELVALKNLAHIKSIAYEALCAEFFEKSGTMLETVIDSINEKAMDNIGDIIFDSSTLEIIEDYRDDVYNTIE